MQKEKEWFRKLRFNFNTLWGLIILLIWEGATVAFNVPVYILPPPHLAVIDFIENYQYILLETLYTFGAALIGFILAIGLAFLLSILFSTYPLAEKSIFPFFIASQAIPIAAFSIILIAIFGSSFISEVIIVIYLVFVPITVNWVKGLSSSDPDAISMMRSFGATRKEIFWQLRMYDSLPFLFSAAKVGALVAITGAIVGEFVGIPHGLGVILLRSIYYMDAVRMWLVIAICAILGTGFYYLISLFEKRIMWWKFSNGK
jgi:NitT/TauT family transport system permease protein